MKKLTKEEYRSGYGDPAEIGDGTVSLYETGPEDCRLPKRRPVSHKYSYGRALIIGGCRGFSGAPRLAANACERSGAGLTHVMVPESIYPIVAACCDGAVVTPLCTAEQGSVGTGALEEVLPVLKAADACAVGPGLGRSEEAHRLVSGILREADCPLVLDADALTICGMETELLSVCKVPVILTPHEGEFKRLGGDLSQGRLEGALAFAARYPNAVLVLKGHGTLICSGSEVFVNPTGSAAMAKGGSGDVLSGMLCALLAQGFEPLFAARTAAYLHGLAGDLASRELGEYCVTPSDLIGHLPAAFRTVTTAEAGAAVG
ncbi:MAG: NAD(P)H-hydrate dehydratase [Oscillospiraceae bacterium]|nr:NAD(P)H-hydrate dehydratase [Oscillospiraceae bacterium]